MAKVKISKIELSSRAFWYFLGYYIWNIIKRYTIGLFVITTVGSSVSLIRSGRALGASDSELLTTWAKPLPKVIPIYLGLVLFYSLIRAITDIKCNRYTLSPQGLVIETGFLSKHITVVSYAHIQKMTIVANPFDRLLRATTVHIELVGHSVAPIALEAVDISFAKEFQQQLSTKLQSQRKHHLLKAGTTKKTSRAKRHSTAIA